MSAQRESKLKLNRPNHVSVRKQIVHVLDFGSFLHATFAVFLINSVSCLPHGGWPSFYFKTVIDSCVVSDPSVGVTVFAGQFCQGGHHESAEFGSHLLRQMAGWFWCVEVSSKFFFSDFSILPHVLILQLPPQLEEDGVLLLFSYF